MNTTAADRDPAPHSGPPASETAPRGVQRLRAATPALHWAIPVLVFVLLSLFGITTSSIGVDKLRRDADHPVGTTWGEPQSIRADEFMTWSPITMGAITAGPGGTTNPLGASHNFFHQLPSGPVSSVVFFDGAAATWLGPWLPDAMLFSAKWWLPTLLLFLGVPAWFRHVTGSRRWGYLACALIYFAPANAWWSGLPVNTLGFMFAACALLLAAHTKFEEGKRWSGAGIGLVSAILMARYPSYYQPWAIVLGFPVLIATTLVILKREGRLSRKWAVLVMTGVAAATLTALSMLENLAAIRAGLDTVYPGLRRDTSRPISLSHIFNAPALGALDTFDGKLLGTNKSELSSAFTALIFAIPVMLPVCWRWISTPGRWALGAFTISTAVWLLWCTTYFGPVGSAIPLVSMVPSFRAAQVVGFLATIAFCLVLAYWRGPNTIGVAIATSCIIAWITFYAGASMRYLEAPAIPQWSIYGGGVLAGLCVFLLIAWPGSRIPLAVTVVAAALLTGLVNPIQFGLADLRGTPAANFLIGEGRKARAEKTLWASDSNRIDALFFATGTPSLSFRQQIGPNRREWERLDPGAKHIKMWNRGGTFVEFDWNDSPTISWEQSRPDKVEMTTSPCTVARRFPTLTNVVSEDRLNEDCLTYVRRLKFGGDDHYVYTIGL